MFKLTLYTIFLLSCSQEDNLANFKDYNFSSELPNPVILPSELNEISGLARDHDNVIYGHHDEAAYVYALSQTGEILSRFAVGNPVLDGDFEGIAIVDDLFYLVTSKGDIYEFEKGENGTSVGYKKHETHLSSKNDIEGLCYYPKENSLLLITKADPDIKGKHLKTVWRFSLETQKLSKKPYFELSTKELKKLSFYKTFEPSGIEYNPIRDTFFIIAANGHSICEVNENGKILRAEKLGHIHKQVEGITLLEDGTLFISDEGKNGSATLSKYEFKGDR